jgi:AraC family transcriptional regulator, transcriptional activator of pobA
MDAGSRNLYFSYMTRTTTVALRPKDDAPIPAFVLYGEPLDAPAERLIHIETIAARSQLHDWHIRAHRHASLHQILLLRRGQVQARLDGRDLHLAAPVALVVPPGVIHSFRFTPETVGFVVSIDTDVVNELAPGNGGLRRLLDEPSGTALQRLALAQTDLWAVGTMLLREFERSAAGRPIALRGLLAALLANVLRLVRSGPQYPSQSAAQRELVARFRQRLEEHVRDHAGVSTYADALGVSSVSLRRACLAVTGQAPVELIQSRRVLEAERQLRYTSMTISQVAYYLGFDDPAYFSRFFTRRAGLSPRRFREKDGLETVATDAD